MKDLQYIGTFDTGILKQQLLSAFPDWRYQSEGIVIEYFGMNYDELAHRLVLSVPDSADENAILQIVDAHDPTAQLFTPLNWDEVIQSRLNFMQMPNWATWTAEQAQTYISNEILAGMTQAQIEAWIDTNVTNIVTAKTALKLVGDELIDLREICMNMAKALVYLRDVAIRRRL